MGDADLLYRAFLNIFNNALQAAETGGLKVRVSTRESTQNGRSFVVAAIEDQGPGFSKEAKASLFDPFFTTKEKGTGLGMSIVSNIVASHKGRVEVGNSPLGGAKVEVWLPVAGE
jgi:signal transduction histidine kinase